MASKKKMYGFSLTPETKALLKELADKEARSESSMVEWLILQEAERRKSQSASS